MASRTAWIARGPRLLSILLAILYGLFWLWYGGRSSPLTQTEVDTLLGTIEARGRSQGEPNADLLEALRRVGEADDGHEFFMLNLIRHREKAVYPAGSGYDDDVQAAEERYAAGILPRLLKRASFPVFLGTPRGLFLQPEGADEWDQVVLVRYRSRRDFLSMVAEPGMRELGQHKWASVGKTQVFPVSPVLSFIWVRTAVAVVLAALGAALHLLLRRAPWYRSR